MERLKEPNKGMFSPPGGKLISEEAESPTRCAVREVFEECSIVSNEKDWKLIGIIGEKNYPVVGNIMIFLMEYRNFVEELPPECNEGAFYFVHPDEFPEKNIPVTDKLFIWDEIMKKDKEVFMMTLDCSDYPVIKTA